MQYLKYILLGLAAYLLYFLIIFTMAAYEMLTGYALHTI